MMSAARYGIAGWLVGALLWFTGGVPAARAEQAALDAAVYRAIVDHTIRPEMEKVAAGSRLPARPPLLIVDHTLALCDAAVAQQKVVGCLDSLVFDALNGGARIRELAFADLLDASARSVLSGELRRT